MKQDEETRRKECVYLMYQRKITFYFYAELLWARTVVGSPTIAWIEQLLEEELWGFNSTKKVF